MYFVRFPDPGLPADQTTRRGRLRPSRAPSRNTTSRENLNRELWRLQDWEDRLRRWQTALIVWTVVVVLAVLALLCIPRGGWPWS